MKIEQEPFGKTADGHEVSLFRLSNASGLKADITNYGCIVVRLCVPDREGRFAFCPRVPGKWRIEADDGMGHKAQSIILVEQKTAEKPYENYGPEVKADRPAKTSKLLKTALGLSLIANLAFAVYVWRPGRRPRKKSSRG